MDKTDEMLYSLPIAQVKSFHMLKNLAHCDFNSVCFNLDECARLKREWEKGEKVSAEHETKSPQSSCTSCLFSFSSVNTGRSLCECTERFCPGGGSSGNEMLQVCSKKFVNEIYGSVCYPRLSVLFKQGHHQNYLYLMNKKRRSNSRNEASYYGPYSPLDHHSIDLNYNNSRRTRKYGPTSSLYLDVFDHTPTVECVRTQTLETDVDETIIKWDSYPGDVTYFRFEYVDYGSLSYRAYYHGKQHYNFVGTDQNYGPFVISMKLEGVEKKLDVEDHGEWINSPQYNSPASHNQIQYPGESGSKKKGMALTFFSQYRIIARFISDQNLRVVVPVNDDCYRNSSQVSQSKYCRMIIDKILPQISQSSISLVSGNSKIQEDLLKFDESCTMIQTFKVGIIYCSSGQESEADMYNNYHGSFEFDKFLELIGRKVKLKDFKGYGGQLDTESDYSGTHSIYSEFHNRKIMFHVSTMLPSDNTAQQITKKRYIGNDIVTVVFQDADSPPLSPNVFKSQFQHVFILVRAFIVESSKVKYKVAVTRARDVPHFGPPIYKEYFNHGEEFKEFILTKIVNAECASQKGNKFHFLATRTRYQALTELVKSYSLNSNDSYGKRSLIEKPQKKPLKKLSFEIFQEFVHNFTNCALVWNAKLYERTSDKWINCTLCISAFCISLVNRLLKEPLVCVVNKFVVAWMITKTNCFKIFHRAGNFFEIKLVEPNDSNIREVISRVKTVSSATEAKLVTFDYKIMHRQEFMLDDTAVVNKIECKQIIVEEKFAVGDRILEINGVPLCRLSVDQFYNMLLEKGDKSLLLARPSERRKRFFVRNSSIEAPARMSDINSQNSEPLSSADRFERCAGSANTKVGNNPNLCSNFFNFPNPICTPEASSYRISNQNEALNIVSRFHYLRPPPRGPSLGRPISQSSGHLVAPGEPLRPATRTRCLASDEAEYSGCRTSSMAARIQTFSKAPFVPPTTVKNRVIPEPPARRTSVNKLGRFPPGQNSDDFHRPEFV